MFVLAKLIIPMITMTTAEAIENIFAHLNPFILDLTIR
jgi:hypothetical protein